MSESPGSSRTVVLIALLVGLGVGLAVAFLLGRGSGGDEAAAPAPVAGETRDGDPEALAELPDPVDPVAADAVTDPETALDSFLATEASGDWEESYTYLTEALRTTAYTTPAAWVRAHADFPTVIGHRIDGVEVDEEAGTATVQTLTGFEATLDPVIGLVAARGRTRWTLEQDEEGLWRVNTNATENQPLYPSSEGAAETARSWVDARVDCQDTTALEEGLIGTRALATRLCEEDQDEPVAVDGVGPLSDTADVSTLLSEFGPEVFAWARTVRVDATTPLTVVLGPVGEEWKVVAVISAGV